MTQSTTQQLSNSTTSWTSIIRPRSGWFDINIRDLWRYRDLVQLFVRRDFIAIYKQTILGPLWFLLQPMFSTLVYMIVFSKIAKIPTDGVPPMLFYLSGIIVWNYFAPCLTKTSETFIANAAIFGKVYFPRLAIPVSVAITNLISFSIQFCLFLVILISYRMGGLQLSLSGHIALIPILLVMMASLGVGMGVLISSLTTRYRDLAYLVSFGVQLWMYATPVVYPVSLIPEKWKWIYILNPMAPIVETFRYAFLGVGSARLWHLGVSAGIVLVILLAGVILFSRIEKTFMDTV